MLNNPRRWNTDAALAKHFSLPYETTLEFRAEAFNIFNATSFVFTILPSEIRRKTLRAVTPALERTTRRLAVTGQTALTGSSFLHPVDAHRPRTIQFGLKLAF